MAIAESEDHVGPDYSNRAEWPPPLDTSPAGQKAHDVSYQAAWRVADEMEDVFHRVSDEIYGVFPHDGTLKEQQARVADVINFYQWVVKILTDCGSLSLIHFIESQITMAQISADAFAGTKHS